MIRVGFVQDLDAGWLGGAHYFKSLFGALLSAPDLGVTPVLITRPRRDAAILRDFPSVEHVETRLLPGRGPPSLARKVLVRARLSEPLLLLRLALARLDLVSHCVDGAAPGARPWLGWIPDFQHRRLPEFFSPDERRGRDALHRELLARCRLMIVSSADVLADLRRFHPEHAGKGRVLRFVVDPTTRPATDRDELARRYGLRGPFFHLPNQLWAHKNHRVVIDALALLAASGRRVTVLATGNTTDYRRPGFHRELIDHAARQGVAEDFRVLGLVPYPDLVGLMRGSVAIINPSLFEGWSTTVEEAKSLGKRVLVSDIPVHREQAPAGGTYFDPADPGELAEALRRALDERDPGAEARLAQEAAASLDARRRAFASDYARIALEALTCRGGPSCTVEGEG